MGARIYRGVDMRDDFLADFFFWLVCIDDYAVFGDFSAEVQNA